MPIQQNRRVISVYGQPGTPADEPRQTVDDCGVVSAGERGNTRGLPPAR